MVPLIAAAGLAVALGATAVAWLINEETNDERRRQDDLRRDHDHYRQQYRDAFDSYQGKSEHRRRVVAEELTRRLREVCEGNRARLEGPKQEFKALAQSLKENLADGSISPFRRNALRLLQTRLEDAQSRIDAFDGYCDWYLEQLEYRLKESQFDLVIQTEPPQSRLPEDWLYHGKVALASVQELSKVPNAYDQQIELKGRKFSAKEGGKDAHYSNAEQHAWMLGRHDPEAIPVQLFRRKNPDLKKKFSACLLRGAIYVEHVLEQVPCSAIVIRPTIHQTLGDGYWLRCFPEFCQVDRHTTPESGIKAFLPRSESSFPGKRYSDGERLDVYLHYHDLLLERDVTVTQQIDSLAIGTSSASPVFVHADGRELDLHPLRQELAAGASWQLRGFNVHQQPPVVTFQVGNWTVETETDDSNGQLRIIRLAATGIDTLQLDELPFSVRLIDSRWKDTVFSDRLKFNELVQFCHAQYLFSVDERARKAAAVFFDRWREVTDYLLEEEGYHDYPLTLQGDSGESESDCICELNLLEPLQDLEEKSSRTPSIALERCYVTPVGEERWLQIASVHGIDSFSEGRYRLLHAGIRLPDSALGLRPKTPAAVRLRFPNQGALANLHRQKRALQAMMNGRLTNPSLQQILIMPERYVPQPSPQWQERIKRGLSWHNQHWRDPANAQHAKRIVEEALIESNLYLIQGPPGTGKTTCIVEMLQQIFAAHPMTRVLVVSQQNTAVDNALERFVEQSPQWKNEIVRIGNEPQKMAASVRGRAVNTLMENYLGERQREYSSSCISLPARAAWLKKWMDNIAYVDGQQLRFDSELTELLIGEYPLVGATCVGLASRRYGLDRFEFDVCIIDEGGRASVPELLIPLLRCRKAIIIGDHYQLPPNIASRLREDEAKNALPFLEEAFLKKTFFEHLYLNLPILRCTVNNGHSCFMRPAVFC